MAIKGDFLKNHFKEKIEKGECPLGVGMETTSPDVAEVFATTDYDWLFIDGEHGPHTVQTILQVARTISPYEMTPVVRIGEPGTGIIKQLMDSGIQNLIFPKVESKEEAEKIVYWSSYPPFGNRGMGAGAVRAARFGKIENYQERIADETVLLIQLESKKGFDNLDEIVQTKGIGGIFLGPVDLAVDLGHGTNIFHPQVVEMMENAIKRLKELGVIVGTIAVTPEQAKHYRNLGASFLAIGTDTLFLRMTADATIKQYKDVLL
ncbi:MAG: 2,4-dihydroxyhept-2-ene-1,7-dioic acid aldolase [Alphaproteobacteria bacterium]|nr:2,4-dihydroxyhept-2-ene-1,7-dioic acid aldolase [Alphaproteobacteria bacterium]